MAAVTITCPHCGLNRTVPEERIPEGLVEANCPRCRRSFPLTRPRSAANGAAVHPGGEPPPSPAEKPRPTKLICTVCGYSRRLPPAAPVRLKVFCPQCGNLLVSDVGERKEEPGAPNPSPEAAATTKGPGTGSSLIRFRDFLRGRWPKAR